MKETSSGCSSLVRDQLAVKANIKEAQDNIQAFGIQVQLYEDEQRRIESIYHNATSARSKMEKDLLKWEQEHSIRWKKVVGTSSLVGVVLGVGTMGIGLIPGLAIGAIGGIGTGIVAKEVIKPEEAKQEILDCQVTMNYCNQMSSKTVSQLSELAFFKQEVLYLLQHHIEQRNVLQYKIDTQKRKLKELTQLDQAIKEYLQYVTKVEASARVVERHSRDLHIVPKFAGPHQTVAG